MSNEDDLNYVELRSRVERRVKVRQRQMHRAMLGGNIVLFVIFIATAWLFNVTHSAFFQNFDATGLLITVTMLWALAIFLQFLAVSSDNDAAEKRLRTQYLREELDEATLNRMMGGADWQATEKPKHILADDASAVRLSDDGELVPIERAKTTHSQQS